MAASTLQMSTTIMWLFFGTNLLLMFFFIALQWQKKEELTLTVKKSEAFRGTPKCYTLLTSELARVGLIMAITYICENHWFFEHSGKVYNRDLFMFVCIIFFAYGYLTIKPVKDLALLGREQTEEWKGWMQFIFLLYHYFHAEEVYNSVRVMITCYVWMTGFGNFSFFYIKQDFGWLRVLQMLWRLNFAVLFLMMTHGNTYILYYICPLHTFFFLMVYATMFIGSSWNHGKWSVRWKIAILGVIIFLVWDFNHGLFEMLFSWLGTESIIGAKGGSVWEWYFRTSLDHWSTYFGMIFAMNFPLCEQLFVKLKGWPLYFVAAVLGASSVWWYMNIYSLEKLAYNLHHNYFALIPLTSYIYFRNITPYIRSFVSVSFHDVGKTTLETYLLQHHVWLTSNAKTLLTIVPGYPWITFALASVMFVVLAKELYRLTMTVRGMILPDDKDMAKRNFIGFMAVMISFSAIGAVMHSGSHNSIIELSIACTVLFIVALAVIGAVGGLSTDSAFRATRNKAIPVSAVATVLFILAAFHMSGTDTTMSTPDSYRESRVAAIPGDDTKCLPFVADGSWHYNEACSVLVPGGDRAAYCQTGSWLWNPGASRAAGCTRNFASLSSEATRNMLHGKKVHFCGDSGIRSLYHAMNKLVDRSYDHEKYVSNEAMKHADFHNEYTNPDGSKSVTLTFKWVPRVINMSQCFVSGSGDDDIYIVGMLLWDVLQGHDANAYRESLSTQAPFLSKHTVLWVQPQRIVNSALRTSEKQQYMTEEAVSTYRGLVDEVLAADPKKKYATVINPVNISASKEGSSTDGVHYSQDVYDTTSQVVLNALAIVKPSLQVNSGQIKPAVTAPFEPKPPTSMSFPGWGAMVLVTALVMIFTMDSFFGIGYLALIISGRSFDYDAAYLPLLNKIFGSSRPVSRTPVQDDTPRSEEEEKESLLGRNPLSIEKEDDGKV